jgi:hypothetical protein
MIAVNFPNNPIGAIDDQIAFRALAELCAERGIHLFSDEVYRGLEREDAKRRAAGEEHRGGSGCVAQAPHDRSRPGGSRVELPRDNGWRLSAETGPALEFAQMWIYPAP